MQIMKNDNGKIRVFEVDEFIKKLVEKNAIDKRDVMDYKKKSTGIVRKIKQ